MTPERCPKCRADWDPGARECFACGYAPADAEPAEPRRDPGEFPPAAPPDDEAEDAEEHLSWCRVDLSDVLDGTWRRPRPAVGTRDDGHGLFYPGKVHTVASEAEGGKTWLALHATAQEIKAGNGAVYIDFEDDEAGAAGRLMAMGADPAVISARFGYIRPDEPLGMYGNRGRLAEALGDLKPSLVVIDGVTEAMTMHGLDLRDNADVATFGRTLVRPIARGGAAAVALDHVAKDRDRQGGYAIGGVHKLNGADVAYILDNRDPFGIGLTGRSEILIKKDRPGQLRRHGRRSHDGLYRYADLVIVSHGEEFAEVSVPATATDGAAPQRPTAIMAKISAVLASTPGELSQTSIEGLIPSRTRTVRLALELLVNDGYVTRDKRGQTHWHKHVRPFHE
jgi:hypothetical protein